MSFSTRSARRRSFSLCPSHRRRSLPSNASTTRTARGRSSATPRCGAGSAASTRGCSRSAASRCSCRWPSWRWRCGSSGSSPSGCSGATPPSSGASTSSSGASASPATGTAPSSSCATCSSPWGPRCRSPCRRSSGSRWSSCCPCASASATSPGASTGLTTLTLRPTSAWWSSCRWLPSTLRTQIAWLWRGSSLEPLHYPWFLCSAP
mmetsp:Transcript_17560/g.51295  ORF Transcript_17560/g.51295 Transcript_17560/m.51295 type:complete len:207 (+) Transcript_17560:233-853(+)